MRIADARNTDQIVEEVNNAVAEARQAVSMAMTVGILNHQDDGVEWSNCEGARDLAVTIAPAPTKFSMIQAVDQIGKLDPSVIAAADADPEPALILVDDPARVRHEPELKHILEENAAGLIEDLGYGLWVFRVEEARTGIRLCLLNPRLVNGKPAILNAVDTQRIILDSRTRWEPGGPADGRPHYLRATAAPHLIEERDSK